MITNYNFFQRAVYLSVDWVPKLIQKSFQTMEQTFVQRCETKVVADACNASYTVNYNPLPEGVPKGQARGNF